MGKHREDARPAGPARPGARHALVTEEGRVRTLTIGSSSLLALGLGVAGIAALVGASLAVTDGARGLAATVGTVVLGVSAVAVWLAVALAAVRVGLGSRRDNGRRELVAVEQMTSNAAHRADRPRPRVPWYAGVEVSFDLA
jgi:hypothetical protein